MVTQADSQAVDALNIARERIAEALYALNPQYDYRFTQDVKVPFAGLHEGDAEPVYEMADAALKAVFAWLEKIELPQPLLESAADDFRLQSISARGSLHCFRAIIGDLRRLSLKGESK